MYFLTHTELTHDHKLHFITVTIIKRASSWKGSLNRACSLLLKNLCQRIYAKEFVHNLYGTYYFQNPLELTLQLTFNNGGSGILLLKANINSSCGSAWVIQMNQNIFKAHAH